MLSQTWKIQTSSQPIHKYFIQWKFCYYVFVRVSSSVPQLCPTVCEPLECSTPGLPVHHQLPVSTQTHVHRVGDAIQSSHTLSSPSPPALNLSQPASGSFPMSWLIPSGGQRIGASAPTSTCIQVYSKKHFRELFKRKTGRF